MAGIGFDLERLFERDTFLGDALAHAVAGTVLAGAWMFGIFAIFLVFLISQTSLSRIDLLTLFTMLMYANAMAMILTSVLSLPLNRFLADHFYTGDVDAIGPTYAGAAIVHLAIGVVVGGVFYALNPLSLSLKLLGVLLTVAYMHLWLTSSFISVLRSYWSVIATFVVGYSLGTGASIYLGHLYGLVGYLLGFTMGVLTIGAMLTAFLEVKLSFHRAVSFEFLGYVSKKPFLVLVGACLALGCWIDKVIFWIGMPTALQVTPLLRAYPDYDMSYFMGYISAVPALSWTLLMVETNFAQSVRAFYSSLSHRKPREQLLSDKRELVECMNSDFWGVMKVQAPITLLTLFLAPHILETFRLPSHLAHIFRYSALAGLAITFLQTQILYLLYFDLPARAFLPSAVFLVANAVFTQVTLSWGSWSYGLGNLTATILATVVGVWLVNGSLPKLEFLVLRDFGRLSISQRGRSEGDRMPQDSILAGSVSIE